MKVFGRYLRYRLKSSALRSVIITVISLLFTQNILRSSAVASDEHLYWNDSCIGTISVILAMLASIIPILETKYFKNRRNLDTLYFFPIKRSKMALVHYLCGLIQMTFAYTVTYFAAFAFLAINMGISVL